MLPIPYMAVRGTAGAAGSTGTNSPGGGSGGYIFNPDEIDAVIKDWKDLYQGLEADEDEALNIANVEAPGLEFASGDFKGAAGPSGDALLKQVREMRDYVQEYIAALTRARDGTIAQDEQNAEEANKAGGHARMSSVRRPAGILLALAASISLAACGNTADGQPNPRQHADSTNASATTSNPAVPDVTDPLDVSALRTNPCAALSDAQRNELNLKQGTTYGDDSGEQESGFPDCKYEYASAFGNQVSIEVSQKLNGLDDVYSKRATLKHFEPTEISGYPAVYAARIDGSEDGVCQLYVGVNNTTVVRLLAQLSDNTGDYSRPCDVVKLTAKTMIKNLKG